MVDEKAVERTEKRHRKQKNEALEHLKALSKILNKAASQELYWDDVSGAGPIYEKAAERLEKTIEEFEGERDKE